MWLLEDYYYAWQDVESFVRKDGAGNILLFFVVGKITQALLPDKPRYMVTRCNVR